MNKKSLIIIISAIVVWRFITLEYVFLNVILAVLCSAVFVMFYKKDIVKVLKFDR